MKQNILIFGESGQLAKCLKDSFKDWLPYFNIKLCGRSCIDITKWSHVQSLLDTEHPSLVINASAYTAVDEAENNPLDAFQLNTLAPEYIARKCKLLDIPIIHISTDYVYDGTSDVPYKPSDTPNPLNIYGKSKLAGEWACQLEHPSKSYIIRTSWGFSKEGNNFVNTMLNLARNQKIIPVIHDQVGCPTYMPDLAEALFKISYEILFSSINAPGIYHYTNAGICSWYEFACQILENETVDIKKITTKEFPRTAIRPTYSALNSTNILEVFSLNQRPWQEALLDCMNEK